jgi:UDP-N-acetylglucosamine 3-dehydrogenase
MTLRAGVIGIGVMGRHHSRVLATLEGVDFIGVHDPAQNVPESIEGKPVIRNLDTFLDLKPDYCVIAAPTIYHLDLGRTLAQYGIHALIEKPVASDSDSAAELVKLFEDANLIGGVGHIERFNPALQSMRDRIEDGQLGEIYQVATRRQGPFPGRIADVGVVKDLATHDLDLTAWVTQQHYVSVNARTTHKSGRPHEDMVVAIGTLSQGTITNHIVNWLSPMKERTTIVTGEYGTLVADTLTADLTFYENGTTDVVWQEVSAFRGVTEGDVTRYALKKREPLKTEHEGFLAAVLKGDTSGIVTLAEGLRVLETAEMIVADGIKRRLIE